MIKAFESFSCSFNPFPLSDQKNCKNFFTTARNPRSFLEFLALTQTRFSFNLIMVVTSPQTTEKSHNFLSIKLPLLFMQIFAFCFFRASPSKTRATINYETRTPGPLICFLERTFASISASLIIIRHYIFSHCTFPLRSNYS
jgi:hypothetical protein